MKDDKLQRALRHALDAVNYACAKHGDRTIDHQPLDTRVRILVEEVGEVAAECQNVQEAQAAGMPGSERIYRKYLANELSQVAACVVLWLADELAKLEDS